MKFILDSSVISKLFIKEKGSINAMDMMTLGYSKNVTFIASELVRYEVGNVLWKHLRKTDIDGVELINRFYLLNLEYVPIDNDLATDVMRLAHKDDITYYDAAHVALADRYQAELITEDKKLLKMFDIAINIGDALKRIQEECSGI